MIVAIIAALAVINLIYSVNHVADDQKFYRYSSQAMYHEDFYEDGRYPDLFLRALIRDKKVILPRELKTYDMYSTYGRDEEDGNPFDKNYLIENDYIRYFETYARETETDTSLYQMDEAEEVFAGKERSSSYSRKSDITGDKTPLITEDFTSLGIANDLLRYSFPLNHEEVQQARGFWYYWYYHHFADKEPDRPESYPEIIVCMDGLSEADSLVAVWDENENLYLMSKERYSR